MNNNELSIQLIELVGGKENITLVENCMTRLRIEIKDNAMFRKQDIKNLKGVLGMIEEGNYKQIIVGPGKAKKLCDIVKEELGIQ